MAEMFATDAQGNKFWMEAGFDFGTSSIIVYLTVRKNGKAIWNPIILPLQLGEIVPAVLAFHDGRVYWGNDALNKVAELKIPAATVIECLKLAMYDGSSGAKKRALLQLKKAGYTVGEAIALLINHIVIAIRESVCKTKCQVYFHSYEPGFLKNMPLRTRIGVPHSFGPEASRTLTTAAIKAGISLVHVVSEQICVLAACMDAFRENGFDIPDDTVILFTDGGCGTIDSVLHKKVGGEGSFGQYEPLRESTGSVSGGQKVNEPVIQWIMAAISGELGAILERMGMTKEDFKFHLGRAIEAGKKKFEPGLDRSDDSRVDTLVVINHTTNEEFQYKLTRKMVKDALDMVIDENFPGIDKLINVQKPTFLVAAGAFGTCSYMIKKLAERYEKQGIHIFPVSGPTERATLVAQGAISPRYGMIDVQTIPLGRGYMVLQDEFFQLGVHTDCVNVYPSGAKRAIEARVRRVDPEAPLNTRTVHDRLNFIICKGQLPGEMTPVYLVFNPYVDERVVSAKLVCTELDGLKNHGAALAMDVDYDVSNPRERNRLRDGILPWIEAEWKLSKKVMKEHSWKTAKDQYTGGLRYIDVWTRLGIRYRDGKLVAELELIPPTAVPKSGKIPQVWEPSKTISVAGDLKLWDGTQSEFLSDGDRGSRPVDSSSRSDQDSDGDISMEDDE